MRGKQIIFRPVKRSHRLIPAGAGKTFLRVRILLASSAHPRRCGENAGGVFLCHFLSGSSPQVRGKPQRCNEPLVTRRLIPAGAGKTSAAASKTQAWTAHPRRCGENALGSSALGSSAGSSPQVRGKLGVHHPVRVRERLIPAGAGKTFARRGCVRKSAAHPRRCGENYYTFL